MAERIVVLLSGGLDSTTLLYDALEQKFDVTALSVDYGQRHLRELASAEVIASQVGVPLINVHLGKALAPIFALAQSSQVGQMVDVPKGHYADESMKTTIVPNRNMMLLAVAGALATSIGAKRVAYAAHAGDHAIYPDCRPEFVTALNEAMLLGTNVSIERPFIERTKTDIVRHGAKLKVPFELTYSCYEGRGQHCGVCGTCFERREAFRDAGVPDPTRYSAPIQVLS